MVQVLVQKLCMGKFFCYPYKIFCAKLVQYSIPTVDLKSEMGFGCVK